MMIENNSTARLKPLALYDAVNTRAYPVSANWPDYRHHEGYRWTHLDSNDRNAVKWVEALLPPLAGRALLQTEIRPRCEGHDDGVTVNLRGVVKDAHTKMIEIMPIRLWITKHSVVSLGNLSETATMQLHDEFDAGRAPEAVGDFLAALVHEITDNIEVLSIELDERTDTLEDRSLTNQTVGADQIASIEHALIRLRRAIGPQRDALAHLVAKGRKILSDQNVADITEDINRTQRAIEELDLARERLIAVKDKLDADHDKAIGRNSYVLSVIAAIFLPLGFLTGLFGVNVAGMPGLNTPGAFWILTGGMLISGIALYFIFRFAKWL